MRHAAHHTAEEVAAAEDSAWILRSRLFGILFDREIIAFVTIGG